MRNLTQKAGDAAAAAHRPRVKSKVRAVKVHELSFADVGWMLPQVLTQYTQSAAARFREFVLFTIVSRLPPLALKGRNGGQQQRLDVELLSYRFGVGIGITRLRRPELVGVELYGGRAAPVTGTSFLLPAEHRSPAARCCKATEVLRIFCDGDLLCWDHLSPGLSHRNSRGEQVVMFSRRLT
jgi:hypothetical protein